MAGSTGGGPMKSPILEDVVEAAPGPEGTPPPTRTQMERTVDTGVAEASGLGRAFLLEIGTEEVPDWMIPSALESLRLLFEKTGLLYDSVQLDATPRRLVLRAQGLPLRLPDRTERVQGPAKGAPTQAVAGFARKHSVSPEDLILEVTAKGEYYVHLKRVPGRTTKEILAESLP